MLYRFFILFFSLFLSVLGADLILIDSKQSLIWQDDKNVLTQKSSWSDATNYCQNLKLSNKDDWRLPTINELTYALDNIDFVYKSSESFWTNAQFVFLPFDPWKAQTNTKDDLCCSDSKVFTRCVRDR